jgi:cytochrome c oxidase subunit 3
MKMANVMNVQRERIHPHKFTLWVGIGSIIMMFAGLTSAYIVKRSQSGWVMLEIPILFWVSTVTILLSSVCIHLALKNFRKRNLERYRQLLLLTLLLGIAFLVMQVSGFYMYREMDIRLTGAGSNASHSFILAIAGLHGIHVLGGIVALAYIAFKSYSVSRREYNIVPAEIIATYWHFVDLLWLYLIVFFNWMR